MVNIERFSEAARFARKAVEKGAHFHAPQGSNLTKVKNWEGNVDKTLTYLFGQDEGLDNTRHFSLGDVGRIFPKKDGEVPSRERVRQVVESTVFDLWQNSPPRLQAQHPLERLKENLGKPKFLTRPEGTTRNVLEDVDRGFGYRSLIKKHQGTDLGNAGKVLAPYGVVVPVFESVWLPFIKELEDAGPDRDPKALKDLIGRVNFSFMINHPEVFKSHFTNLASLLRKIGFYFREQDMDAFINRMSISDDLHLGHVAKEVHSGPQKGELNYYFVYRFQEKEIAQVLLSDQDLSGFLQNPVRQIAGVNLPKAPTTSELQTNNCRSVSSLCRELGIRVGGGGLKVRIEDLVEGSLVSVWAYESRLYYPSTQEEAFKGFLLQRARSLGLMR